MYKRDVELFLFLTKSSILGDIFTFREVPKFLLGEESTPSRSG